MKVTEVKIIETASLLAQGFNKKIPTQRYKTIEVSQPHWESSSPVITIISVIRADGKWQLSHTEGLLEGVK